MGQQLKDGLGQAWNMVATFVPKLVGFLIVLLIGWLIAKAVSKALGLVLGKVGFGRLVEKTGLNGVVGQQKIDGRLQDEREGRIAIRGGEHPMARADQAAAQKPAEVVVVLGQQDPCHGVS